MPSVPKYHQSSILRPAERKALQGKGQFWTPQWVARAMVRYLWNEDPVPVFDPALGAGAFFRAAKDLGAELGFVPRLSGVELYEEVLTEAKENGLSPADLDGVSIGDFMDYQFPSKALGIIANPPYLRHHKIGKSKASIQAMAAKAGGERIDGRAGLHVYFLIKCLINLAANGRLAIIMPADTCEGVFAPKLWKWIVANYRLEAVVTFEPEATPFPGIDTNAVIFFLKNSKPVSDFRWARWSSKDASLEEWVASGFGSSVGGNPTIVRTLSEGLRSGLSRPAAEVESGLPLGQFATIVRGIATGGNEFFFLNSLEVAKSGIPAEHFVRAVGRTRDVEGGKITPKDLERLDRAGRPTYLLYLGDEARETLPLAVRKYIARGEREGIDKRFLAASRRPWYKMEKRNIPPILFAYLGRSDTRFIRNTARVRPLTGFLCVYPKDVTPTGVAKLWSALRDPETVANLAKVGKSYGSGAIKVEPRALDNLLIPTAVLKRAGLL